MTSTTQGKPYPFAGSRAKTCCGRLAGCACRRSNRDITNTSGYFSGNFSSTGQSFFGFNKCNNVRCKIKCKDNNMLMPLNNFKSQFSKKSYTILTDRNLDCKSSNIIYLVTCKLCRMQYVGETVREFGIRMREHWDKIRKGDKSQLIYAHFQCDEVHRNANIEDMLRFQIIEKVRTDNLECQDQGTIRRRRLERELFWIAKLRTAHPLGLNDKIQAYGISGNATDKNFKDYNFYRISNLGEGKRKGNHGRHLRKKKGGSDEDMLRSFRDELEVTYNTRLDHLESVIGGKQRGFLVKFVSSVHFQQLDRKIKYILENRIAYIRKVEPVRKKSEGVLWKVDFTHKIMEDLNIRAVYNKRELLGLLPTELRKKDSFRLIFRYGRSIASKILNYNQVLKDLQDISYEEIEGMNCHCDGSVWVDTNHGHIMTGNLDIIEDEALRDLCRHGTKFREVPLLNSGKIKEEMKVSVDNLITKLASKHKIPKGRLKQWREGFLKQINDKIDFLAKSKKWDRPVLGNRDSKKELDRLKDLYVITVVDKAAGNFAFTCKKFYLLRLARELGINNENPGNDTYEFQDRSEGDICTGLTDRLAIYGAKPDQKEEKLAMLYHNPKFHKNPVKFRFIAGNVKVVTSKLDEIVAKILKMCKGHFSSLCKKYESFSGIRYCFDIEKSSDLKKGLDRFQGNASSISINDFATLYTLFEHDHLVRNMSWLLNRLSKNSGNYFIRVNHEGAYWVKDNSKSGTYNMTEILEMIEFLIGNSYVKALGKIFKQTKGIIMGGKSSGWLSDCSLMVDEFRYIDKKVKEGETEMARKFVGLNRYRDDCSALNIDNFQEIARDIYPASLELTQENDDLSQATVLDMHVKISGGWFKTKVYNKTDSFPFEVISLPFLASNICNKICYKVFYSQVLRYQRLCSDLGDFIDRTKMLAGILLKRGYKMGILCREFMGVIGNYKSEFERWDIPSDVKSWFDNIVTNSQTNSLTDRPIDNEVAFHFSQPLPETIGQRINLYSQF